MRWENHFQLWIQIDIIRCFVWVFKNNPAHKNEQKERREDDNLNCILNIFEIKSNLINNLNSIQSFFNSKKSFPLQLSSQTRQFHSFSLFISNLQGISLLVVFESYFNSKAHSRLNFSKAYLSLSLLDYYMLLCFSSRQHPTKKTTSLNSMDGWKFHPIKLIVVFVRSFVLSQLNVLIT